MDVDVNSQKIDPGIYIVNAMKTMVNVCSVAKRTTFNNAQFIGFLTSLTKQNK